MVFGVLRAEICRAAHALHVGLIYRRMDESERIWHDNEYFFEKLAVLGQKKKAKSAPDVKILLISTFVVSTTQQVLELQAQLSGSINK